jgi:hypothetical protein
MIFINFDEATSFLPTKKIEGGKSVDDYIHFMHDSGFVVMRVEFTKEELKALRDAGGRAYVVQGPGQSRPVPFHLQTANPLQPAPEKKPEGKILGLNGKPLT